jgi:DNA-directed RNA polymerase subunit alpha
MLQIQCLQSETHEVNTLFSRFAIGPLKKGQGLTIGNALRRVLLSDLPGLAIVGVRITDVNHEFSTIPCVKEDVIDILLNLKQVVLKGILSEPTLARLSFQGPGIITAKDIELPSSISLVEPNQYIATVNSSKLIEIEILVNGGEGYVINTKNPNQVPEGFLALDAVFMPVNKVNFFIETASKINSTQLESLILEVYTNGSITPTAAVSDAAQILQHLFGLLTETGLSQHEKSINDQTLRVEQGRQTSYAIG